MDLSIKLPDHSPVSVQHRSYGPPPEFGILVNLRQHRNTPPTAVGLIPQILSEGISAHARGPWEIPRT